MWSVVRKIKAESSVDENCGVNGLYEDMILKQLKMVEHELQYNSSDEILEDITASDLKISAEMYIFLNICPHGDYATWFKTWYSFYTDLFKTQSPDEIILTLNRMTKINAAQTKDGNVMMAEKLLKEATSLMTLKYQEIKSLLPEAQRRNSQSQDKNHDLMIKDGTYALPLFHHLVI